MNQPVFHAHISLQKSGRPVFAAGAWFKNAVCATRGDQAVISRVAGDLDTPEACAAHDALSRECLRWMEAPPAAIACDLHPDFYSSRKAAELAHQFSVPLIPVQHHHAHIASVCAEQGIEPSVIGLALDGVGLGSDGRAWGGELLHVVAEKFTRLGHFKPLALPGGDKAAREPWRVASAVLHALGRGEEILQRYADEAAAATLTTMLDRHLNSPPTSSAGRVFDAAAGLLGISRRMAFEAQAAIALEQAATRHISAHGWPPAIEGWRIDENGVLNLLPALGALTQEKEADLGAARFHATLVAALSTWLRRAAEQTGLDVVVCGGGCFLNKLLVAGLQKNAADLTLVFANKTLSPGDAGLALGQAVVAQRSF